MRDPRPQRLVFGQAAESYERYRPGYPPELFDFLAEQVGAVAEPRAVEIGAGTGKATRELARRGFAVFAVEPDVAMAEVGRTACAPWPSVSYLVGDFESIDVPPATADLAISAQAWHWVRPTEAIPRVRSCLRTGGVFGLFWNSPRRVDPDLDREIDEAFQRHLPGVGDLGGKATAAGQRSAQEIDDTGLFSPMQRREWSHRVRYSTQDFLGNLGTHSDHLLLPAERRSAFFGAIGDACERHSGSVELEYRTELFWTRPA